MNANELADALQETEPYYSTDYKLFDKAAAMLRQQAKELDEAGHMIGVLREQLQEEIQARANALDDLNNRMMKFMKSYNEMAWKLEEVGGAYTHPVKELTDEDYKEALACLQFALDDTMDYLTLNNLGGENNHWLVWARAILKKASEK